MCDNRGGGVHTRSEIGVQRQRGVDSEGLAFWAIVVMMKNMVVLADLKIFINFVGKCIYADRLRYWVCTELDDLIIFRAA